jgi:hypothetical protein
MKKFATLLSVVCLMVIPTVIASADAAHVAGVAATNCGSFKYGIDGLQPGPSGIKASGVSCWFARATALLGAAPGWACRITVGITLVCRSSKYAGTVTYYGE